MLELVLLTWAVGATLIAVIEHQESSLWRRLYLDAVRAIDWLEGRVVEDRLVEAGLMQPDERSEERLRP